MLSRSHGQRTAVMAVVLLVTACGGSASPTGLPASPPLSNRPSAAAPGTAAITAAGASASSPTTRPSNSSTSEPASSTYTSHAFAVPVSFELGAGWKVTEDVHSDIDLRGPIYSDGRAGDQDLEFHDINTTTVAGTTKSDPYMPWPTDLYAWLQSRPEFQAQPPQTITVAGRPATQIDVDGTVKPGTRVELVCADRSSCWLLDGNFRWRFVELKNADGSGVVWITSGVPAARFDTYAEALDELLRTVEFR